VLNVYDMVVVPAESGVKPPVPSMVPTDGAEDDQAPPVVPIEYVAIAPVQAEDGPEMAPGVA